MRDYGLDQKQLAADLDLCQEANEAFPDSDFAKSCQAWIDSGRLLTDKQRTGLERTISAAWDGGLDDDE